MTHRCAAYRISALVVLFASFYAWDWMPLRIAQRDVIGWSVRVSGYNPAMFIYEGSPALSVEGCVHYYTAECTYLDLLMMVLPFVWVFGSSARSNILRIGIVTLVILGGNLVRCWAAVYLDVQGVGRFYAHDLPDYLVWWPTVVIVVLLALQHDLGGHSKPTPRVLDTEMSMPADETFASVAKGL